MGIFGRKRPSAPGRREFAATPLATRAITFYAEDAGSWPHFEPIVRELTGSLGRTVCYLTSSPEDPILTASRPGVHGFHIGEGPGRAFLFKSMEAGVVVATVPRLGISVLPRSQLASRLGMEYLYVFHSMASTHMIYDADGFDRYDTVLCVGSYMIDEIRRREALHGLPAKELVLHGYGRLDTILADGPAARGPSEPPVVLVAPSWGPDCIFETCGVALVRVLLDAGFEVIARPHPMTHRHTPAALDTLTETFARHERFSLDSDISSRSSLRRSDLMVSDWSGAALEYAFGIERPVLFIDVPRKVNNPDYVALGIEPFEVTIREQIGRIIAPERLSEAPGVVRELLSDTASFTEAIRSARERHVANVTRSGRFAAELIAEKADRFLSRNGLQ